MESLGLSQKDAQFRKKWRRRFKGQPANLGRASFEKIFTGWHNDSDIKLHRHE